jgi:hypothetical protein
MSRIADIKLNRRSFVKGSLMLGAASPFVLSACSSGSNSGGGSSGAGGTLNWLTWSDHYSTDQLAKVAASTKITGRPKLFSDNADAFLQLKQTGPQFDQVSADALWVKKYMESGLIQPFDLSSIGASSELYSMAKNFDFLNDPKGAIGYPFSWSTVQIYYNPAKVKTPPTTWESLTDPQYKGPDRREHSDRPDGDRRNRHRLRTPGPRPDLVRVQLPGSAQAEHHQARVAEQRDHLDDGHSRVHPTSAPTSASRTQVALTSSGVPAGEERSASSTRR